MHAAHGAQRMGHILQGEVGLDCGGVDRALDRVVLQERPQLGGEREAPAAARVEQGLLAYAIAGAHQTPASRIPDCQREHAPQPLDEPRAEILV